MRTDFVTTGVVCTIDIALYATKACAVNAKQICDRHGWTRRNCEVILQELARAHVLKAHRGPMGGYRIAPTAWRKTLAEVGRAAIRTSRATEKQERTRDAEAALRFVALAEGAYWAQLARVTIEEAATEAGGAEARSLASFERDPTGGAA